MPSPKILPLPNPATSVQDCQTPKATEETTKWKVLSKSGKRERKNVLMQGNRGGLLSMPGVTSSPDIPSPSTEIAEIWPGLPKRGGTFVQMEDEVASICAITVPLWPARRLSLLQAVPAFR